VDHSLLGECFQGSSESVSAFVHHHHLALEVVFKGKVCPFALSPGKTNRFKGSHLNDNSDKNLVLLRMLDSRSSLLFSCRLWFNTALVK
jgi:hypothetical protein